MYTILISTWGSKFIFPIIGIGPMLIIMTIWHIAGNFVSWISHNAIIVFNIHKKMVTLFSAASS